jgi:N-methylhydantoinase A
MLQTDVRHDLAFNYYRLISQVDPLDLSHIFDELIQEGRAALEAESVSIGDMDFEFSSDMRYVGQEYSVNVRIGKDVDLNEIERSFHEAYRVRYGHATPGAPVEFVTLRVAALGVIKGKFSGFQVSENGQEPLTGTRQVIFNGKAHSTPVFKRDWIPVGAVYPAPMIIEEDSATTVVPPGFESHIDQFGNILIIKSEA